MRKKIWFFSALGLFFIAVFVFNSPAPIPKTQAAATCPAEVLDLSNWKQTLPTGKQKKPLEINQPALANYSNDACFKVHSSGQAVVFRSPVNGVTTSGSGYPRSELREMSGNGKDLASWSTTSGAHMMTIDQAITSVPKKKKHIVAGQIHDANDDVIVIRLEYPKLFVDINGKTGPTIDSNYTLGKRFTVQFVADSGQIKVYYNGSQNPVYTLKKKGSGYYFKAGAYTQSNCSKESDCSAGNYGEVVIYNLKVQHASSSKEFVKLSAAPSETTSAEPSAQLASALEPNSPETDTNTNRIAKTDDSPIPASFQAEPKNFSKNNWGLIASIKEIFKNFFTSLIG